MRDRFREGQVGDAVLLIKSGTVEVLKGDGPSQRRLATISGGEVVGEMALEEGEHARTATVKAVTEVEGWRFPGPAFESLIDKNRTFRQKRFSVSSESAGRYHRPSRGGGKQRSENHSAESLQGVSCLSF